MLCLTCPELQLSRGLVAPRDCPAVLPPDLGSGLSPPLLPAYGISEQPASQAQCHLFDVPSLTRSFSLGDERRRGTSLSWVGHDSICFLDPPGPYLSYEDVLVPLPLRERACQGRGRAELSMPPEFAPCTLEL